VPRTLRRILLAIGALALLAAIAVGAGFVWLRTSLPDYDATYWIAGLGAPAEILRDRDGLVTIRANDERDAAFALGFAHAQDRLWQMDFMRRAGAGRLSEVVGKVTLGVDRFMRTLGLYRLAQKNLEALSPDARAVLEAYAAGVNAYLAQRSGALPPEFVLLRYEPEPWTPADSMVWGRIMAVLLSGNWRVEALRAQLARRLTAEQMAVLWPDYPATGPVVLRQAAAAYEATPLRTLAELLPDALRSRSASNSWVVDGRHTSTGAPILANDPHLALRSPGYWYLARVETPEGTLAGATTPGVPFFIIGHNEDIAWGITSTYSDTQDLFLERELIDPAGTYQAPEGPRPFETRQEVISVRGADDVPVTVRATRHGPVISDAVAESRAAAGKGEVLALAWTALREDDRTAEAVYNLNRARSWDDVVEAMRDFDSPQETFLIADRNGDIGLLAPGRVPIRKAGDGSVPVPGWTGEYDWTGAIPYDELPRGLNPPKGRLIAANNRLIGAEYPYLLSFEWPEPYRAERIADMLDDAGDADVAEHAAMQLDALSPAAESLVPLLVSLSSGGGRIQPLLDLLGQWDFVMDRDAAAPLVYYAWLDAINRRLLADELGDAFASFEVPKPTVIADILANHQGWCDDVTTETTVESCTDVVDLALEDALDELIDAFGDDRAGWRWGAVHVARLDHMVLSHSAILRALFDHPIETDGGDHTVNRAGVAHVGPLETRYRDVHGPGLRAVFDLADLDDSRFAMTGGQSGNPLSQYYANLTERWRDGVFVTLASPQGETRNVVHLQPR
jgi:penicillin amidase